MIRITLMFLATSLTSMNVPVDLSTQATAGVGEGQPIIEEVKAEEVINPETPKEIVQEYFADVPIMIDVARCESTFRQHDSTGKVLRGKVNKSDVGVMQINEYYHLEDAQKLGLDIHTIEGNLEYARDLYEKQGLKPWKSSQKCWNA